MTRHAPSARTGSSLFRRSFGAMAGQPGKHFRRPSVGMSDRLATWPDRQRCRRQRGMAGDRAASAHVSRTAVLGARSPAALRMVRDRRQGVVPDKCGVGGRSLLDGRRVDCRRVHCRSRCVALMRGSRSDRRKDAGCQQQHGDRQPVHETLAHVETNGCCWKECQRTPGRDGRRDLEIGRNRDLAFRLGRDVAARFLSLGPRHARPRPRQDPERTSARLYI